MTTSPSDESPLELENNLGIDDTFASFCISIRSAKFHEREVVKELVCRVHIEVSGYNDAAKAQQIVELPDDFPMLFNHNDWSKSKSWLCFDNATNKLIGCIGLYHQKEGVAEVAYFFLESSARGKGYGRTLLRHALNWTKQVNEKAGNTLYTSVDLLTLRVYMEAAIALYQSEGFVIYHEFHSEFFHVVKLCLQLVK
jgi:GNAT superfamily N-acetyltransferase